MIYYFAFDRQHEAFIYLFVTYILKLTLTFISRAQLKIRQFALLELQNV